MPFFGTSNVYVAFRSHGGPQIDPKLDHYSIKTYGFGDPPF